MYTRFLYTNILIYWLRLEEIKIQLIPLNIWIPLWIVNVFFYFSFFIQSFFFVCDIEPLIFKFVKINTNLMCSMKLVALILNLFFLFDFCKFWWYMIHSNLLIFIVAYIKYVRRVLQYFNWFAVVFFVFWLIYYVNKIWLRVLQKYWGILISVKLYDYS